MQKSVFRRIALQFIKDVKHMVEVYSEKLKKWFYLVQDYKNRNVLGNLHRSFSDGARVVRRAADRWRTPRQKSACWFGFFCGIACYHNPIVPVSVTSLLQETNARDVALDEYMGSTFVPMGYPLFRLNKAIKSKNKRSSKNWLCDLNVCKY